MKLKRYRSGAGYVLVGICMLIAMLYLRFPSEALRDWLKTAAMTRYPGLQISIGAVRPSFPPGLGLENVAVSLNEHAEALLQTNRLAVRPSGLNLLRGRLVLLTSAQGYGGKLQSETAFSRFSLAGPFSLEATFRDLRVERSAWLREFLARQVTGVLRGHITFNGVVEALHNGTGTLDFTLANGSYPLLENIFGFEKLDFSRIDGKASFRGGTLRIAQVTLTADNLRCTLKGDILLADNLQASKLSLSGAVDLPGQVNRRLTVTIDGTLGNPRLRFL